MKRLVHCHSSIHISLVLASKCLQVMRIKRSHNNIRIWLVSGWKCHQIRPIHVRILCLTQIHSECMQHLAILSLKWQQPTMPIKARPPMSRHQLIQAHIIFLHHTWDKSIKSHRTPPRIFSSKEKMTCIHQLHQQLNPTLHQRHQLSITMHRFMTIWTIIQLLDQQPIIISISIQCVWESHPTILIIIIKPTIRRCIIIILLICQWITALRALSSVTCDIHQRLNKKCNVCGSTWMLHIQLDNRFALEAIESRAIKSSTQCKKL